ncbi:MAG: metallophosphoesterase [Lachnospiraceae bacterium]|nr:metallophosphoesterase [Lachnospiraceae bacterium]
MRILIVSDTHRKNENFLEVVRREKPLDLLIHCGDVEGSEYVVSEAADCPAYIVMGNNDFFSDLPREVVCDIGSYHVWITHGHNYYVSMGNETIKKVAKQRGMDIVMYGHSHKPVVDMDDGVIALNPGSLSYPRQYDRKPSYILMELDENGKAHFEIRYV